MNINLTFDNINLGINNKIPEISIVVNNKNLYNGVVGSNINVVADSSDIMCLQIHYTNKTDSDTVVDSNGSIVSDMNFTLESIVIDDINFEELIWNSSYITKDNVYPGCLFFGPSGYFEINFTSPVLPWLLKTRNDKNNNDPNWEEDYNYYVKACKILASK